MTINIGDVVIPYSLHTKLRSGCSEYTHAICVSVEPFVLVSKRADMMWQSTMDAGDFISLCQAHPDITKKCMERLND